MPTVPDCQIACHPCWEEIDAIVCINMDESVETWEAFSETVAPLLPAGKWQRLSAVCGKKLPGYGERPWFSEKTGARASHWGGGAGCMLSHRNAIRMAKQKGWRNILIFEDDVVSLATKEGLDMLQQSLRELEGKYLLYLGYAGRPRPYGKELRRCGGSSLWQVNGLITTHAYLVPESMYDLLLAAFPENEADAWEWMARHRAVDNMYRDEVSEWPGVKICALMPQLFQQDRLCKESHRDEVLPPREMGCLFDVTHVLFRPFRRLKKALNSWRMYCLCRWRGFKGGKKKKSPSGVAKSS